MITEVVTTLPIHYSVQPQDANQQFCPLPIRKFPSDGSASDGEYLGAQYLTSQFLLHPVGAHLILHGWNLLKSFSKWNQIREHALKYYKPFNSIASIFCLELASQAQMLPTVASPTITIFSPSSNLRY